MTRVSSYDATAKTPRPGSRWVWEIDKPHARALIEVVESFWNGEEWWVRTRSLLPNAERIPASLRPEVVTDLNDLSRFMEACTFVGGSMKGALVRVAALPKEDAQP